MPQKIVAIIQARMGSTRLPGKVLSDVHGTSMLQLLLNRVSRSKALDEIIIATSTKKENNEILALCNANNISCFRGSETDVLDRYYQAAKEHNADIVVRLTADDPLADPVLLDKYISYFRNNRNQIDCLSTDIPNLSYPFGLRIEVFSFNALKKAWQEDLSQNGHEHVTPYMYQNPDKFYVSGLSHDVDISYIRWTVDTEDDLELIRCIFGHFEHDHFTWQEALEAYLAHPHWQNLNRYSR